MSFYSDNTELNYHCEPRGTYGHGLLRAKFGREMCAKPDGTPKRWLNYLGWRWTLDSAHRNNHKFKPEE